MGLAIFIVLGLAGCGSTVSTSRRGYLTVVNESWMLVPGAKADYLDGQVLKRIPKQPAPGDKRLFADYRADGPSVWAPNWTRGLDFSGVAWDSARAGVLIHPQYLVCASHFSRRKGEIVVFHDRQGNPIRRRVAAQALIHKLGDPDVVVMRLDQPLPATIATYPLLPPGHDYRMLNGAKLLLTDQDRRVHLFQINRVSQTEGFESLGARKALEDELDPAWHKHLVAGDSGHPSFLLVGGRLVLVSTLRGGGWGAKGPFYGGTRLQSALNAAIETLERNAASSRQVGLRQSLTVGLPGVFVGGEGVLLFF